MLERRRRGPAQLGGEAAARMEGAAGGRLAGSATSPFSRMRRRCALAPRIGDRHGREQRLGVGMARPGVELVGRRALDDPADIHDRHAVADVLDHAEVVADEQVGQPELLLQVLQQVQGLGPDADVQRRHRLVRDHQPRIGWPARGRCRCAGARRRRRRADSDGRIRAAGRPARSSPATMLGDLAAGRQPVDAQHLADDVDHRHARVERGLRVLEHHAEVGAVGPPLRLAQRRQVDHFRPLGRDSGWCRRSADRRRGCSG